MREHLFKYKYRPKNFDDLILLPRIKKIIDSGINDHLLFYGSYGLGKTALVNLLGRENPILKLDSSIQTSVEILRNEVDEFCSKMSMFDGKDDLKIVFMDEMDGVSSSYQNALKGFIEKNEKNVRFISTTNHISRIDKGVLDRFLKIDFNPQSPEEVKYLKMNYAKRISKISKKEEITLDSSQIKDIVNKNFPSFRKMLSVLQYIKITGEVNSTVKSFDKELQNSLYEHINGINDSEKTYHFLMNNFGPDHIDELFQLLGRPFIEYMGANHRDKINKLGDMLVLVTKYGDILDQSISADPLVIGTSLIHELKTII